MCFVEPVHVSGVQRLKMAQERAQEKQASLQRDLDSRRTGSTEPAGDGEELMDTSSSVPNGSVNGYPSAASPCLDHTNGGSPSSSLAPELQDFVTMTFQKHTVLTLNELKRLFSLYLASMPAGQNVLGSISDHMLLDAVLLCKCKQIMVPVSNLLFYECFRGNQQDISSPIN